MAAVFKKVFECAGVVGTVAAGCFVGVDFLDIGFRIEREFCVSVSKDDWTSLVRDNDITVGDLYGLILQKLHLEDIGRHDLGLNFRLWSEMQSVLHSVTAVPREQIELNSPLEALFPRDTGANCGTSCETRAGIGLRNSIIRARCGMYARGNRERGADRNATCLANSRRQLVLALVGNARLLGVQRDLF